jgi:protein-tyrosine phosphatase
LKFGVFHLLQWLVRVSFSHFCFGFSVQSYGIESIHFPIQDKWIPNNIGEVASLVEMIVLCVQQGKTIVVHCNGGKGRTGLVVAATLYVLGLPIDEGLRLIRYLFFSLSLSLPSKMLFI